MGMMANEKKSAAQLATELDEGRKALAKLEADLAKQTAKDQEDLRKKLAGTLDAQCGRVPVWPILQVPEGKTPDEYAGQLIDNIKAGAYDGLASDLLQQEIRAPEPRRGVMQALRQRGAVEKGNAYMPKEA